MQQRLLNLEQKSLRIVTPSWYYRLGAEKQCNWCLSTIWEFNGVTQSACGNTVSTDQQEEKHLRPRGCILNTNLKAPAVKRMGFRETNTKAPAARRTGNGGDMLGMICCHIVCLNSFPNRKKETNKQSDLEVVPTRN